MEHSVILIKQKKRIALVAHDNKKQDLLEWALFDKFLLSNHELYATGKQRVIEGVVADAAVEQMASVDAVSDAEKRL